VRRFAFVSLLLIAQSAAAAEKIAPVIHRTQFCERMKSGLCLAKSTNGGFQVEMPFSFNDFEMPATATDGTPVVTYVVGSKSAEGLRFSGTCIALKTGKYPDTLAGTKEQFERKGQLISSKKVSASGVAGMEMKVKSANGGAVIRQFQSGCCVYTIGAEYPASEEHNAARQIDAFVRSFSIVSCPQVSGKCGFAARAR
jgi:hypothetical protein